MTQRTQSSPSFSPPSYDEADLDELSRTSLCGSVDELVAIHAAQVAEVLALQKQETADAHEQEVKKQHQQRRRQVSSMYRKMQARREIRIVERQEAARVVAQREGREIAQKQLARHAAQVQAQRSVNEEERKLTLAHQEQGRQRWSSRLRTTVLLSTFALVAGTAVFTSADGKRADELGALRDAAAHQEEQAQERVQSLSTRLSTTLAARSDERMALEAQLREARADLKTAQEALSDRSADAQGIEKLARSAPRSSQPAPSRVSSSAHQNAEKPFNDLVSGICAAGDPLCGTL